MTTTTLAPPAGPVLDRRRQVVGFLVVAALTTAAYSVLYVLAEPFGSQLANAVALLVTADADTALNHRLSFEVHGRRDACASAGSAASPASPSC